VRPLFLLRWSARDLRRRWLQVAAIALVIAIGTGVYAGLGSTKAWRLQSNDASYEKLGMYDLRVRVAEGADAPTGSMLARLQSLTDPGVVRDAEERLVLPTQVDASTGDQTILVPGRIIGVDVAAGGPHVNGIDVAPKLGRRLADADAGAPVAVLERNFASFYDLPSTGDLLVSGGRRVHYVGLGLSPEYFFVVTEEGGFFAEANFAALFTSLATAQSLTGHEGRVNDLVLRLRPGVDRAAAAKDVERVFATSGLGVTLMQPRDDSSYRILYDDIEGDQRFWNVLAALVLAGAVFGAFNLSSRMVEAQRREIGIGMALGASPRQLALRPLLVGAEIAVFGAVLGVAVGMLAAAAIAPVYRSMLPLPVWKTDLQLGMFLRGAALGFVLPLAATAWPVLRAVRVMPVDAITTTHQRTTGGLSRLLRRMPRPISAFRRMPIGNVLRTPRRTLLTAMGIGAAVATLVAILGLLDSFFATTDRSERETLQRHPDRVVVALDGLVAEDGAQVAAVKASPAVGTVEPALRVAARAGDIDLLLELLDMGSDVWTPTIVRGDDSGLVLNEKAATDLGVAPGDTVEVEHPARRGEGIAMVRSKLTVSGIHPGPFRFNAYLDRSHLAMLGATGIVNELFVLPSAGHSTGDVQRALFDLDGVASVQPVSAVTKVIDDSLSEFTGVFRAIEGFILVLALLIAYNATSINADERARERATLFAFGLRPRRVLALESVEGSLIGILGTVVGVVGGGLVMQWLVHSTIRTTMPDMSLDVVLSGRTVLTAAVLGIVAVTVAPLLTARRLRRMDIPGTLRVIE
jgi:putative ABC transport system permease protein